MAAAVSFFLASCPEECLQEAKRLTITNGGHYTAGDADDRLNSEMILQSQRDPESHHPWQNAWLGKTKQRLDDHQLSFPGKRITAVSINGGPLCDWERGP